MVSYLICLHKCLVSSMVLAAKLVWVLGFKG
jgi:hypothetical protein